MNFGDYSRNLEERPDRWILPIRGRIVRDLRHDGAILTVTLDSDVRVSLGDQAQLALGSIKAPDADVHYVSDAAFVEDALMDAAVLSAVAFKSGSFRAVFDSGYHLNAPRPLPGHPRTTIRDATNFEWSSDDGGLVRFYRK